MLIQNILEKYKNGESISSLSKKYNLPYRQVRKILTDNQVPIRGGRKKKTLPPEALNELKKDFIEGYTYKELSNKFGLDKETIKNIILELDIQRSNNNRINKRILSDYFSTINSSEKAYWLGFLFTDGSVDKYRNTGRIRLQLQEQDIEILEQFKQDLQLDCKIIYDKRVNSTCCSVEFTDEQIFNDLSKYGIIPRKTYETKHLPLGLIPNEYKTAFLLGMFDGDGNFSCSSDYSTDVTIGLTSYHKEIAEEFQLEIDKLIDKKIPNKIRYTDAWHVNWRGRLQVLNILNHLYSSCPRHLKRKYDKYLLLKDSLN